MRLYEVKALAYSEDYSSEWIVDVFSDKEQAEKLCKECNDYIQKLKEPFKDKYVELPDRFGPIGIYNFNLEGIVSQVMSCKMSLRYKIDKFRLFERKPMFNEESSFLYDNNLAEIYVIGLYNSPDKKLIEYSSCGARYTVK